MSKHVAVCVPHGGLVQPRLYQTIFAMQGALEKSGWTFSYTEMELASVAKARNTMVEQALEHGADYVHFVDDDILIPPNVNLLYESDADIISGFYISRQRPHIPQMYEQSTDPKDDGKYYPIIDYTLDSVLEVDAVGAGCLLVKIEVFKKLHKEHQIMAADCGDTLQLPGWTKGLRRFANMGMTLSPWFEFLNRRGEDFYFCERVREHGFRIFVDTRVKCTHVGMFGFNEAHFLNAKEQGMIRLQKENDEDGAN